MVDWFDNRHCHIFSVNRASTCDRQNLIGPLELAKQVYTLVFFVFSKTWYLEIGYDNQQMKVVHLILTCHMCLLSLLLVY